MSDPEPKVFDPDKVISASEPFDVDEFIRTIHEGRDVERKERSGWIAATAILLKCPLASHDRDFSGITGLDVIRAP